jgi:peptidoglycan/xylan/chitin deacetylase (PgdA/CDA1 family)
LADSSIASTCRRLAVFALLALACAPAAVARAETVVSLTFDDGAVSQLEARGPLLAHGMRGTFYINSGLVDSNDYYMDWSQIAGLAGTGNEIGGHTLTHPHLTARNAQHQVCDDRQSLIAHGFDPVSFAYPFGTYNNAVKQIVAGCGYTTARAVGGLTHPGCDDCRDAESIPPGDPFAVRSNPAGSGPMSLSELQGFVTQAEQAGGGWVPLTFHDLCTPSTCPPGSLDDSFAPADFNALLDWLAARAPLGTVVKSVRGTMGFPEAPLPGQGVPAGPPASGAAAPRDTATALASVHARKRQRLRKLRVSAAMAEPGTLSAKGTITLGRRYHLRKASVTAVPGKLMTLRLELTRKGLRAVRRALRRHRRVRVVVQIKATDAAGNTSTTTRRIALTR